MTIQEMFPDGEWKSAVEYLVKCPYCGDHQTHNHCYINVEKGRFYCHYCGEAGSLRKLGKDFGDGAYVDKEAPDYPKQERAKTDFESFPKVTGMSSTMDRLALKYLINRGMTKDEIELYDVRFSSYGRYYGRVLFPVYENGKVVCFMGRAFVEALKPKWMFPHKDETMLTASECLFGYEWSKVVYPTRIVLVEGAFDAIQINRLENVKTTALGIQGKKLSSVQLHKLLSVQNNPEFYVMLDGNASRAELEVGKKLKMYGKKVKLCQLNIYDKGLDEPEKIQSKVELDDILDKANELDMMLEVTKILE